MKNKKILNICLLTFALIALITFILPIKKYEAQLENKTIITVMFYILNTVLIIALITIIVFAIINLFKDNYNYVLLMETMALTALTMVMVNLLIFACMFEFKITLGYILVSIEVFFLANFSQMARLMAKKDNIKINMHLNKKNKDKVVNAKEVKTKQKPEANDETVDNKQQTNNENNGKQNSENKSNQ